MEEKNYVIVSHNMYENYCFYLESVGGEYRFGHVEDAIRFTYEEALNFLLEHKSFGWLGFNVVRIEDCTFDLLYKAAKKNPGRTSCGETFTGSSMLSDKEA